MATLKPQALAASSDDYWRFVKAGFRISPPKSNFLFPNVTQPSEAVNLFRIGNYR